MRIPYKNKESAREVSFEKETIGNTAKNDPTPSTNFVGIYTAYQKA